MDVRCDRCETEYELEDGSVSESGTSVQCTTCGHRFIVARSPASPPQVSMPTPVGGTHADAGPEPAVPEWTLSSDDGKVHRFRDLNTLQKWIVERKASRVDRLSRAGGPWLALGDIEELTPFFSIVDQADRPRASMRTPTPPPARPASAPALSAPASSPAASSPTSSSSSHAPRRPMATPPPPVPAEARKTVSPDGPTVPNRRLPDAGAVEPIPAAAKRSSTRTPGLGMHAGGQGLGPNTFPASGAMATAPGASSSSSPLPAPAAPAVESPTLQVQMPASLAAPARAGMVGPSNPGASGLRTALGADPLRSIPPISRPTTRSDAIFPAGPTEDGFSADFNLPNHRRRNTVIAAVVVMLGAAGGGYALWSQQHGRPPALPPWLAPAPPSKAPGTGTVAKAPSPESQTAPGTEAAAQVATKTTAPSRAPQPTAPSPPKGEAPPAIPVAPGGGAARAETGGGRVRGGGKGAAARNLEGAASARAGGGSANYDCLVAEADRLLEHGQPAKAEKLYNQALAGKPDGVAALTGTAYVLLDRQRHLKAIETFRRVLDAQPTYGPALFGIAESYRARGDAVLALAAYRQYLSISPSGADAPAARRQIKDLESAAGASAPSASRKETAEPADE